MWEEKLGPVAELADPRFGRRRCRPEVDARPVQKRERDSVRIRLRVGDDDVDRAGGLVPDVFRYTTVHAFERGGGARRPAGKRSGEVNSEGRRLDGSPLGGGPFRSRRARERQPEEDSGEAEAPHRKKGIRAALERAAQTAEAAPRNPGRASLFLPDSRMEQDPCRNRRQEETRHALRNRPGMRATRGSVLVVEDDRDLRDAVTEILEEEGFAVARS